jgi:chemotaxis protein histidine kinase CheA
LNADSDFDFFGESDPSLDTGLTDTSAAVEGVDDLFDLADPDESDPPDVGAASSEAPLNTALEDPWGEMELESNQPPQGQSAATAVPLAPLDDPWGVAADNDAVSDDSALNALDSLWDNADEHATTAIDETGLEDSTDLEGVEDGEAAATNSFDTDAEADVFQDIDLPDELALDADLSEPDLSDADFSALDSAELSADDLGTGASGDLSPEETVDAEAGLEDLDALLDADLSPEATADDVTDAIFSAEPESSDFSDLEGFINDEASLTASPDSLLDLEPSSEFDDLDALLGDEDESEIATDDVSSDDDFDDLDALLDDDAPADSSSSASEAMDEFGDLEKLLEQADQTLGGGGSPTIRPGSTGRSSRRTASMGDQTMRVSVKHLDTLSNLVGELVVNRNSLEQDQERLRQFLDNLLFQVQQLNDVGQRMRDLYERSLLESSLISSRQAFHGGGSSAPPRGEKGTAIAMPPVRPLTP